MQNLFSVDSVSLPVVAEITLKSGKVVPVVDALLSDIKCQRMALLDRLRNPDDLSATLDENVPEAVDELVEWLAQNDPDCREWFLSHADDFSAFSLWRSSHASNAQAVTA